MADCQIRKLPTRFVSVAVLIVALFGVASTGQAQAGSYTYTKLMVPGSIYTEASGINASGQVAGTYFDVNGFAHGFRYSGGVYTTVDFPGAAHNYVFGINVAGVVVGGYADSDPIAGPWHAFTWDGTTFTSWDYPGMETDGRAINASGQIVGIYNSGFATPDHGFLKNGEDYVSIDFPGATYTYAFGINDGQFVTGSYRDVAGLLHGFTFSGGVYTPINFPGASQTYLGGVNNQNRMVGWSLQSGRRYGYTLSSLSSFRSFFVPFAGATSTSAKAINNGGQIVGIYTAPDCPNGCGFLATPNPTGIPACTQSVGLGYASGTLTINFTVGAPTPMTWTTWLFMQGNTYRLWSLAVPALTPSLSGSVPIVLPPVGNVVVLSLLTNAAGATLCADYTSINTGSLP